MRFIVAGLLGLLVPGAGHMYVGRRRVGAIFLLPVVVLLLGVAAVYADGGLTALFVIIVTPGVLVGLAWLNVALGAWRMAASLDAARRAPRSRVATGFLAAALVGLVVIPHVFVGRIIASTDDFLNSMFASGPAPSDDPSSPLETEAPWFGFTWNPGRQAEGGFREEPLPSPAPLPSAQPTPGPTRAPLGPYGGGGGAGTLPPLGAAVPWTAPGAIPWGDDGRFDLLLMGSDAGPGRWSRRVDVMLLVEVDVATGKVAMIGLPRNMQNAPYPPGPARDYSSCGCQPGLLNEMYVEATARHPDRWPGTGAIKGIGAVRSVVSELTGRPIDAVLIVDIIGVARVIDALGGVDINVPARVIDTYYPDPYYGNIYLQIDAGQQHMDGRVALAYARSRHGSSDYARMSRQQTLLLAIRDALGVETILNAPALFDAARSTAWTDLPRDSLPALVELFGRAQTASVRQLRIVPNTYPAWLTASEIARIRADIAGLLGPVPAPTDPFAEPNAISNRLADARTEPDVDTGTQPDAHRSALADAGADADTWAHPRTVADRVIFANTGTDTLANGVSVGVRIRNLYHGLAVVVLAAGIVGCGGAGPSGSAGSAASSNDPLALRYTCGRFNFGPEILRAGPGTAERDPNPADEALRTHLAMQGPDIDFLPNTGWILVGIDGQGAEFVALDGDLGMKSVSVENGPNGWNVGGWGECSPRIVLAEGLGAAEWHLDPGSPVPGPETQVLDVLVTEMSCASGRPADGRIVGPEVVVSDDVVLVMFAVRPLPGGQDCPSNPSTRVTIDLGQPLGDRALLDGGRLPPGDPTQPLF